MAFNKDKAKEKFLKDNPKWEGRSYQKSKMKPVTKQTIEKVIALYPDTHNNVIAKMLGVKIHHLTLILNLLKKKNLLPKKKVATAKDDIAEAIDLYAKDKK
jgi:hypothetical protein